LQCHVKSPQHPKLLGANKFAPGSRGSQKAANKFITLQMDMKFARAAREILQVGRNVREYDTAELIILTQNHYILRASMPYLG